MCTVANYLMSMSLSGYFKEKDWRKWANEKINSDENVESWIYNVKDSKDLNDLTIALSPIIIEEEFYKNNSNQYSDGIIGYYYLRYLENEITLGDLLYLSAEEAYAGDTLVPSERFFDLLHKIEEDEGLIKDDDFLSKIDDFYFKFKEVAQKQINLI